jgi:hypothetical protein
MRKFLILFLFIICVSCKYSYKNEIDLMNNDSIMISQSYYDDSGVLQYAEKNLIIINDSIKFEFYKNLNGLYTFRSYDRDNLCTEVFYLTKKDINKLKDYLMID